MVRNKKEGIARGRDSFFLLLMSLTLRCLYCLSRVRFFMLLIKSPNE